MNKKTILTLTISAILCASNVNAANKVADARGNAMGNTGVASADYLTAPFYNPALVANFKANDHLAILLPAIGISVNDTDDSLATIDDLQSFMENYDVSTASSSDIDTLESYLDELDSNAPLSVTAGLGFAIAVPTNLVSVNLFARGYTEVVADVNISDDSNLEDRYNSSTVDMFAFGYAEVGLALAKKFIISGEKVSFGITPKYQSMTTYAQSTSVDNFDLDDYDESEITKNAMNLDLGAMWYQDNFRAGIAVKDLLTQEIEVANISSISKYKLDTQITVAVAYSNNFFTAAVDADLTKQTRFQGLDDDTQFVRFGLEGNAWGWMQLRAGYEIDLQSTLDDTITAGLGFSPFDTANIDIAGAYTGENQLGFSANLALTF